MTLSSKKSRSTLGYYLNNLRSIQVSTDISTKFQFQGHPSICSGEDAKGFYYERGGHARHVTRTTWTNFHSRKPWKLYMERYNWIRDFWGGACLKSSKCDRNCTGKKFHHRGQ